MKYAETTLPKIERIAKQQWLTQEILNLMECRRHLTNKDPIKYRTNIKVTGQRSVVRTVEDLQKIMTILISTIKAKSNRRYPKTKKRKPTQDCEW